MLNPPVYKNAKSPEKESHVRDGGATGMMSEGRVQGICFPLS